MRDDRRAALPQDLVRPGVLGVPVRVEQRRHTTARQLPQRPHERIAKLRRAAVHHDQTFSGRVRQDVRAAARDERQWIGQR